MKKRLMIALAMGVLVAGMLPGVASAAFEEENVASCSDLGSVSLDDLDKVRFCTDVIKDLQKEIAEAVKDVEKKIRHIQKSGDSISIGDMFELQMSMNRLAQMSEMSTSVVNASNSAIMSMARNIKG